MIVRKTRTAIHIRALSYAILEVLEYMKEVKSNVNRSNVHV